MISFENDYLEGAHPAILKRLITTNFEQHPGYGSDNYCKSATEKILKECDTDGAVYYLTGGTQTNQILLDAITKSYEGIIAPSSGHIATHEAGAIEYTGHKILEVPSYDGKLKAKDVKSYCDRFYDDKSHMHMVYPGVVFLTFPTELGTLYTKEELVEIREVADEYGLRVYLDGARLAYGLMAEGNNVTLKDIASLVDLFYIGGTKVGCLYGEAAVFPNKENVPPYFSNFIKKHGALNAKGRILGLQFDTLFTDNLYYEIGKYADRLAIVINKAFVKNGYKMFVESQTNQQFVILDNEEAERLAQEFAFTFWEKLDENHTVYRFVTDWATKEENVLKLIKTLSNK